MCHYLIDVERNDALAVELLRGELYVVLGDADHKAEYGRCDDPAPPDAPAVTEVDQGVADEAGQQRDEGAECGAEQRQHAVLDGDVRVGHGAGDRYEASADEEQCGTDGDGHDALYRCIFHKYHSFIVYFC